MEFEGGDLPDTAAPPQAPTSTAIGLLAEDIEVASPEDLLFEQEAMRSASVNSVAISLGLSGQSPAPPDLPNLSRPPSVASALGSVNDGNMTPVVSPRTDEV